MIASEQQSYIDLINFDAFRNTLIDSSIIIIIIFITVFYDEHLKIIPIRMLDTNVKVFCN